MKRREMSARQDGETKHTETDTDEGRLPAVCRRGDCFTYLLRCSDGSLYCGWTNDLAHRLQAHGEGSGSKYTASRRPVALVYAERMRSRSEAMHREAAIKRMTRAEKLRLIGQEQNELDGRAPEVFRAGGPGEGQSRE